MDSSHTNVSLEASLACKSTKIDTIRNTSRPDQLVFKGISTKTIRLKTTLPCRSSLLEAHLRRPASRNVRGLVNGNRQHLNREPDRSIPEKSLRCGNKIQCIISVYVAQDSLFAADIDVYVCRKVLFRPLLLTEYHIPLGVVIFYFA